MIAAMVMSSAVREANTEPLDLVSEPAAAEAAVREIGEGPTQAEAKNRLLEGFGQADNFASRSILYRSLLPASAFQEGQVLFEQVIDVESPPLVLTRPANVVDKRRQKAEKRILLSPS